MKHSWILVFALGLVGCVGSDNDSRSESPDAGTEEESDSQSSETGVTDESQTDEDGDNGATDQTDAPDEGDTTDEATDTATDGDATDGDEPAATDEAATDGSTPADEDAGSDEPTSDDAGTAEPEPSGPQPALELPDECTQSSASTSPTACTVQYSCPSGTAYSECTETEDGWDCYCSDPTHTLSTSLGGATGIDACDAMVAMCLSYESVEYDGSIECSPYAQTTTTTACEQTVECLASTEFEGGLTASTTEYNSSTCTTSTDGSWNCSCSFGDRTAAYLLSGTETPPCDLSLSLCESTEELVYDGDEECQPLTQSSSEASCTLSQTCTSTADVGDGMTATRSQSRSTTCQPDGDTWSCRCQNGTSPALDFVVETEATPADNCATASSFCSALQDITLDGPVSCETTSQTSTTTSCEAQLQCQLTKDVEGTVVSRSEGLVTRCAVGADDSFDCSCTAAGDSTTFQLAPAETPFETCSNATSRCEDWLAE